MPDLMIYQDVIACRLNNHYQASKKRLFELFYYRIYGYSVSTEQSKRSAIPVALLPRLSFWAIVARRHDRHRLRRQGDGPPVVSPVETDTHGVQAQSECEAPQLAAKLPAEKIH